MDGGYQGLWGGGIKSYFLTYRVSVPKMKSSEDGQWKVQGGKRMGSRRDSIWGGG